MKFSIGHRLFVAIVLSIVVVAGTGIELTRWKLLDNFSAGVTPGAPEQLSKLADALTTRYRLHHDWSFLPGKVEERKAWMRNLVRSLETEEVRRGGALPSPSLEYRIGLLDRNGNFLAGSTAKPLTVTFASIDTIRQPVSVDGRDIGYLVLARPQNPDDALAVAFLVDQQDNLAAVAVIGVLLSALAAALLAAYVRRPIALLVDGARKLGAAQFDTRIASGRNDELGELADTFNQLAVKLEQAEQTRRQWVADTAHELRTPLSVLRAQLEALQDGVRVPTGQNLAVMLVQIQALTALVDDLHALACADIGQLRFEKSDVEVWPLVVETMASYVETIRKAGLSAAIGDAPPVSTVHVDPARLRQVLANLLENCVRYTAAGGRIQVHAGVMDRTLRITFDDSAPAVPPESLGRLGERFFRVEPSRNRQLGGSGLGLALCRRILEGQGGVLEFAASPLGGLRATILLKLDGS